MFDRDTLIMIALFAFVGVYVISMIVKKRTNLKKVDNGEDMARIKAAVAEVLPDAEKYQVLYGYYDELVMIRPKRGNVYRYHYYALAFDDTQLFVVPLDVKNDTEFKVMKPLLFTKDNVGEVSAMPVEKKGELNSISCILKDKARESEFHIEVYVLNYRAESYRHFNIRQLEEAKRFYHFLASFAEQVKEANASQA